MSQPVQQGQNVVPPDSDSIYRSLTSLSTSNPTAYQAIVRTNNPPPGIGGFLFDIPGDEEVRLRSQVTNYFLENNSPVQDNIALDPPALTLRGMVAELVLGISKSPPVAAVGSALPLVPAMVPPMTPQQTQTYADAQAAAETQAKEGQDAAAADGTSQSLYAYYEGTVSGNSATTRQTDAFLYFRELWAGQQLVSVETPWGIWQNCAIMDVRVVQDARSKYASDFTVTLQEIRFAGEAVVQTGTLPGRNVSAGVQTQDGNAGQTPATGQQSSVLLSIFGPPN